NESDGCLGCEVVLGWVCENPPDGPSTCERSMVCGDGIHWDGECDDHNTQSIDGCDSECRVEDGWDCYALDSFTTSTCVRIRCADGRISATEQFDDNNLIDHDGCSAGCEIEPGRVCHGAPSVCTLGCGNGTLEPGEECDDHNRENHDGCDE